MSKSDDRYSVHAPNDCKLSPGYPDRTDQKIAVSP
jgi:hypothetical protein